MDKNEPNKVADETLEDFHQPSLKQKIEASNNVNQLLGVNSTPDNFHEFTERDQFSEAMYEFNNAQEAFDNKLLNETSKELYEKCNGIMGEISDYVNENFEDIKMNTTPDNVLLFLEGKYLGPKPDPNLDTNLKWLDEKIAELRINIQNCLGHVKKKVA